MDGLAGDEGALRPDQQAHHGGDLVDRAEALRAGSGGSCGWAAPARPPPPRAVSMAPGDSALQVILCGASSTASARISPSRPDLEAETWQRLGVPTWVETPDMRHERAALALGHHLRDERLAEQEGAVERHRHDLAPFLERHVEERGLAAQSGVAHQDVDAAERAAA